MNVVPLSCFKKLGSISSAEPASLTKKRKKAQGWQEAGGRSSRRGQDRAVPMLHLAPIQLPHSPELPIRGTDREKGGDWFLAGRRRAIIGCWAQRGRRVPIGCWK